jgi:hypothetical protein
VPANSGFGTAQDAATFSGAGPYVSARIASLQHRFGRVDVIADETLPIPGSVGTYDLRAQDPRGAFGQPMLDLLSGRYPVAASEVALSPVLASQLGLGVGDVWHQGGMARTVVGIAQNPQSLLDEFALVPPGQVSAPAQVTVLFDAPGLPPGMIGPNVSTPASVASNILAMSVGLIRSETSSDLRTLAATGASSVTRRTVTAATAGAMGLLGGVLGTFAGYVGVIGWLRDNSLNGGISALRNVPVNNLLVLLIGTPIAAVAWLLAGREPAAMAHQPIE